MNGAQRTAHNPSDRGGLERRARESMTGAPAFFGFANRGQYKDFPYLWKNQPKNVEYALGTYSNGVDAPAKAAARGMRFISIEVWAPDTGSMNTLDTLKAADYGTWDVYQSKQ